MTVAMENKGAAYACPACGYQTRIKSSMYAHLYTKKKPCPQSKLRIVLTEEIKQIIMVDRVYIPPVVVAVPAPAPVPVAVPVAQPVPTVNQTVNQTINQHNIVQNFIATLPHMVKLQDYMAYKEIGIRPLETRLMKRFKPKVERIQNNPASCELRTRDLLEIIDGASSINDRVENMNVFYDENLNKLSLFDGRWRSMLIDIGMSEFIYVIQETYLDAYECYLIRKLEQCEGSSGKLMMRGGLEDLLMEYYKFITCFSLKPFIRQRSDQFILSYKIVDDGDSEESDGSGDDEPEDETFRISETYMNRFERITSDTSKTEVDRIKKDVFQIIKRNSKQNVLELNKRVSSLFHMEEGFKNKIMKHALIH